jgi:hypothetical protein
MAIIQICHAPLVFSRFIIDAVEGSLERLNRLYWSISIALARPGILVKKRGYEHDGSDRGRIIKFTGDFARFNSWEYGKWVFLMKNTLNFHALFRDIRPYRTITIKITYSLLRSSFFEVGLSSCNTLRKKMGGLLAYSPLGFGAFLVSKYLGGRFIRRITGYIFPNLNMLVSSHPSYSKYYELAQNKRLVIVICFCKYKTVYNQ